MTAGQMRDRVRIETRVLGPDDGAGNRLEDWAARATVWAEIRALNRGEAVQAGKLEGRRTAEIRIRWSRAVADVSPDDRVVEPRSGEVWNIRAVEDRDRRRAILTLTCETGVAT